MIMWTFAYVAEMSNVVILIGASRKGVTKSQQVEDFKTG